MKTRREEIREELQALDRKIYALQNTREELQKDYDSTPETQAGKNEVETVFHENLKSYADRAVQDGRIKPLVPGEVARMTPKTI